MSSRFPPSAREIPPHSSISLPFVFRSDDNGLLEDFDLACSSSHVVVCHENLVYVYSSPAFELDHILNPGELLYDNPLEIRGDILVITCKDGSDSSAVQLSSLYIWDLVAAKYRGIVAGVRCTASCPRKIAFPRTEVVEIEGNGKIVKEEWPTDPLLVVISLGDGNTASGSMTDMLRTYAILEADVVRPEGFGQEPLPPATTIHPIHEVTRLASRGRTALTAGKDASVRVWDSITGECLLVLIGHAAFVIDVDLDSKRIYSSSNDYTVRIWDRYSGDCLHVLEISRHLFGLTFVGLTPSCLATFTGGEVCVLDPVSAKLIRRINVDERASAWLGPIREKEHTIFTWENCRDSTIRAKLWDTKLGRVLTAFPIGRCKRFSPLNPESQSRFLLAVVEQDGQDLLKIWDFGVDGSPNAVNFGNIKLEYNALDSDAVG